MKPQWRLLLYFTFMKPQWRLVLYFTFAMGAALAMGPFIGRARRRRCQCQGKNAHQLTHTFLLRPPAPPCPPKRPAPSHVSRAPNSRVGFYSRNLKIATSLMFNSIKFAEVLLNSRKTL